jgi:hypothetical protein
MSKNVGAETLDPSRIRPASGQDQQGRSFPRVDSSRATARAVGILMLAGFLTYGVGSAIATGIAEPDNGGDSGLLFLAATLSMLLNSAIVIGIGVLMVPILQQHNRAIAGGYLLTRIVEGTALAIGVASLVWLSGRAAVDTNLLAYSIAMAGLGFGSLFFCFLLFMTRLVPRFLAAWGFIGYATMAAGCLLEIAGVGGAGTVGVIPGGLFELTFAIWLITRGFNRASVNARAAVHVSAAGTTSSSRTNLS